MASSPSTVKAERLLQLLYKRAVIALDAFRQIQNPQTRPLELELAIILKESESIIKNGRYLDHFKYDPEWEVRFLKRKYAELKARKSPKPKTVEIKAQVVKVPAEPKPEPPKTTPEPKHGSKPVVVQPGKSSSRLAVHK